MTDPSTPPRPWWIVERRSPTAREPVEWEAYIAMRTQEWTLRAVRSALTAGPGFGLGRAAAAAELQPAVAAAEASSLLLGVAALEAEFLADVLRGCYGTAGALDKVTAWLAEAVILRRAGEET